MKTLKKASWLLVIPAITGLACIHQSDELGSRLIKRANSFAAAVLPNDPSAPTAGLIGDKAAELDDGFHVYDGALEGGATGTTTDVSASLLPNSIIGENSFDMPSGGRPSPLFGAAAWTQKLLLFEEFGTEALMASAGTETLPLPGTSTIPNNPEMGANRLENSPNGPALEAFLGTTGLYPYPQRLANDTFQNPWAEAICDYLNRADCTKMGPIEGRPPGEGWAHQRWKEFFPVKSFKTAQAGARTNLGFRDKRQLHGYKVGEFAPGGLYHNTAGFTGFNGTTAGLKIRFHPNMPVQNHNSVWTFDGTLPPKLLMVRYGEPLLMRHFNALPIDVAANKGFGLHTISTHEHNGHHPAESDGFAGAFYFPGQYYDYRWPMILAGHDSINTNASDVRAATPCQKGEIIRLMRTNTTEMVPCDTSRDPKGLHGTANIRGDYRETMSTHWFHDHMIDFTSQNVYKGNAAMMNYYSAIDRGNESLNDGVNLRLPSGSGLAWGNRDYDVNLVLADKAWDRAGQLWFNPFNRNGFLGDMMTVNFQYKPVLDVRARRYRFRILNGAVARYVKLALVKQVNNLSGSIKGPAGKNMSYEPITFHLVANDGNIMEHSVAFDGTLGTKKGILPTQAIAERMDIIIDFAKHGLKPGDKLYLVNLIEHRDGRRPKDVIPLADVLSERYKGIVSGDKWIKGDPTVGAFMQFSVAACRNQLNQIIACQDPSMDPAQFIAGNKFGPNGTAKKMLVRPNFSAEELRTARHRTFKFNRGSGTDTAPWTISTDGGSSYIADTRRISAAPNLAAVDQFGKPKAEIWHLEGGVGGWSHPVHIHFEEGIILNRDGLPPPEWEKWARKDMFRLGGEEEGSSKMSVAYRFREFSGSYVEHCHNTTHEDHAMLLRWDLEKPGQTLLMPSPVPTWDGVRYVDSVAVPSFRTGDVKRSTP